MKIKVKIINLDVIINPIFSCEHLLINNNVCNSLRKRKSFYFIALGVCSSLFPDQYYKDCFELGGKCYCQFEAAPYEVKHTI